MAVATDEHNTHTATFLLGILLLADYLEVGLKDLGYSVAELEDDLL